MRWIIEIDREEAERGLQWAREFFSRFDTSKAQWLRIDRGRGRLTGAYGRCWYPTKKLPFCRLSCQVPGPFPHRLQTRQTPIYRRSDGSWPPVPKGCKKGTYCTSTRNGVTTEWFRIVGHTNLETLDEAIVWIVSHEAFHFLRRTRQIEGRNTEIEADRFADHQLAFFRAS